jgi:hypothetical protein
VRFGQKLNRYTYSRNNPINFLDPSGLDDECTWDGVTVTCDIGDPPPGWQPPGWQGQPPDWQSLPHGGPPDGSVDCAMLPVSPPGGCYGLPGNEDPGNGPPQVPGPVPPVVTPPDDTQQPDNPLYNCQNGLKTNCPGNRAGTGASQTGTGASQNGGVQSTGAGSQESWITNLAPSAWVLSLQYTHIIPVIKGLAGPGFTVGAEVVWIPEKGWGVFGQVGFGGGVGGSGGSVMGGPIWNLTSLRDYTRDFVDTYFPIGAPVSVFWSPRDSSYFGLPDPNSSFGLKSGIGGPA